MSLKRLTYELIKEIYINGNLMTVDGQGILKINGIPVGGGIVNIPYPLTLSHTGNSLTLDNHSITSTQNLLLNAFGSSLTLNNNGISVNGAQIHDLADPILSSDAATKDYVDNNILTVPFTTGILTCTDNSIGINNINPDITGHLFNVTYSGATLSFDSRNLFASDSISINGHNNTTINAGLGAISLNSNNELMITCPGMSFVNPVNISNIASPVQSNDVAIKSYVDSPSLPYNPGCLYVTSSSIGISNPLPDSSGFQLSIKKLGNLLNFDASTINATSNLLIQSNGQINLSTTLLNFTSQTRISNVQDPVNAQDAATRSWVLANAVPLSVPFTKGILSVTNNSCAINFTTPDTLGYLFNVYSNSNNLGLNSDIIYASSAFTLQSVSDLTLTSDGIIYLNASSKISLTSQVNISNLADPVTNQDATTKVYVDNLVSSLNISNYATTSYVNSLFDLPFNLGILTLTGSAVGIKNTNPNTSSYAFNVGDGFGISNLGMSSNSIYCHSSGIFTLLADTGITVQANNGSITLTTNNSVNLGNQVNIQNVADPVHNQDAATKNYVDTSINSLSIGNYATTSYVDTNISNVNSSISSLQTTSSSNSSNISDIQNHMLYLSSNTVTLQPGDLTGLYSNGSGIVLVSGVTNKTIIPFSIEFYYQFNSVPYNSTGNLIVSYAGAIYAPTIIIPTNANADFDSIVNDSLLTASADRRLFAMNSNSSGIFPNAQGIDLILNVTANITSGDSPLKIRVTYFLIDRLT